MVRLKSKDHRGFSTRRGEHREREIYDQGIYQKVTVFHLLDLNLRQIQFFTGNKSRKIRTSPNLESLMDFVINKARTESWESDTGKRNYYQPTYNLHCCNM